MTLAMFYPRRKFNGYNFAGIAALAEATAPELILEWGGVGEARSEEPRAGDGFLERGQPAPPHQLGVCGSAVSSLSGVRGVAPAAEGFSCILSRQIAIPSISVRVAHSLHG